LDVWGGTLNGIVPRSLCSDHSHSSPILDGTVLDGTTISFDPTPALDPDCPSNQKRFRFSILDLINGGTDEEFVVLTNLRVRCVRPLPTTVTLSLGGLGGGLGGVMLGPLRIEGFVSEDAEEFDLLDLFGLGFRPWTPLLALSRYFQSEHLLVFDRCDTEQPPPTVSVVARRLCRTQSVRDKPSLNRFSFPEGMLRAFIRFGRLHSQTFTLPTMPAIADDTDAIRTSEFSCVLNAQLVVSGLLIGFPNGNMSAGISRVRLETVSGLPKLVWTREEAIAATDRFFGGRTDFWTLSFMIPEDKDGIAKGARVDLPHMMDPVHAPCNPGAFCASRINDELALVFEFDLDDAETWNATEKPRDVDVLCVQWNNQIVSDGIMGVEFVSD